MKRTFAAALLAFSLFVLPSAAQAQKKNAPAPTGGITPEMMQSIKQSYGASATDKALRNIMVNNSPAKMAMNYENAA